MITAWPDPAAYGAAFRPIYDLVFPMDDDARQAARFLFDLAPAERREFAEYGIGTGRVALPLARLGAAVVGVDISRDLLAGARTRSEDYGVAVGLHHGDLRDWAPERPVPVAYCICATLSMLRTTEDVEQALATMSRAVTSDGAVVVETHHPAAVRAVHAAASPGPLRLPVPGLGGALSMTSKLAAGIWVLEHRWTQDGVDHRAEERSLVLPPEELAGLAARAGLRTVRWYSSWHGDPPDPTRPTVIAVLTR